MEEVIKEKNKGLGLKESKLGELVKNINMLEVNDRREQTSDGLLATFVASASVHQCMMFTRQLADSTLLDCLSTIFEIYILNHQCMQTVTGLWITGSWILKIDNFFPKIMRSSFLNKYPGTGDLVKIS